MLKYQKTKTIACKENNRSSNIVMANLIMGCSLHTKSTYTAPCHYCYVSRFGRKFVYINTNTDEILNECDKWVSTKPIVKIPDQVHQSLYLVDIAADVDVNYYYNKYDWIYVFDWFKNHKRLGATFATKWVNTKLLQYESDSLRVRMSLMPESLRVKLEHGTSPIDKRIKFLNDLTNNFETHINLSPIVYYDGWLQDYELLFQDIEKNTSNEFKQQMKAECIFLTSNQFLHNKNIERGLLEAESLLWRPKIQESKISQYGGDNVRYEHIFKAQLIKQFRELYERYFGNTIRYIF